MKWMSALWTMLYESLLTGCKSGLAETGGGFAIASGTETVSESGDWYDDRINTVGLKELSHERTHSLVHST